MSNLLVNTVEDTTMWYHCQQWLPHCGIMICSEVSMDSTEFSQIRRHLGKTQAQIARLLGVSTKAIQSFEQGWRNVPAHSERQLLFLLYLKSLPDAGCEPCWDKRSCPLKARKECPAWEFKAGNLCWFINGTLCEGKVQQNWQKKMQLCRQCKVFISLIPAFK